jgi:hypothetical protein
MEKGIKMCGNKTLMGYKEQDGMTENTKEVLKIIEESLEGYMKDLVFLKRDPESVKKCVDQFMEETKNDTHLKRDFDIKVTQDKNGPLSMCVDFKIPLEDVINAQIANYNNTHDFFKLFKHGEWYPKNIAERGVPENTLFEYVSHTFLNGFINHVTPFFVCVIERYRRWSFKEKINDPEHRLYPFSLYEWKAYAKDCDTNYSRIDDDVLLLAESDNSLWFFWNDKDCSDCEIGRIDKNSISKEKMKDLLIDFIEQHDSSDRSDNYDCEGITGRWMRLPLPSGWIKF